MFSMAQVLEFMAPSPMGDCPQNDSDRPRQLKRMLLFLPRQATLFSSVHNCTSSLACAGIRTGTSIISNAHKRPY